MGIWTFYDYVSPNGRNVIAEWTEDELSLAAQEKLEVRLVHLGGVERVDWKRPHFAPLTQCHGISEIKFDVDNKQHRIFGWFGPNRHEYTMLLGWIKKGKKGYLTQCRTAIPRARMVNLGGGRYIREHGT